MNVAIDEPVDHDVADTDHPDAAQGLEKFLQGGKVHGHQAVMSV